MGHGGVTVTPPVGVLEVRRGEETRLAGLPRGGGGVGVFVGGGRMGRG